MKNRCFYEKRREKVL